MTTQANHTPGPWQAEDGLDEPTVESEDFVVASCHQARAMDDGESVANARLIAAAPEMAEALEWCLELITRLYEGFIELSDEGVSPLGDPDRAARTSDRLNHRLDEATNKLEGLLRTAGVLAEGTGS